MAGSSKDISRRSFIAGGVAIASSLFLPQIEGMQDAFSVLPFGAKKAYAADGKSSIETDIMVVGRTELGVITYDVTDPQNPIVVPNCHVKITSRFNDKSVEGTSNEEGKIIFDLEDLAEDKNADYLAFNGRIEVTCNGYRDVIIPLARIITHSALTAPTRPLDGKPYFRTIAMNEWDVQYTKETYMTSSESDESQVIEAELWIPNNTSLPTLSLVGIKDGKETNLGRFNFASRESKNVARYRIYGKYLLKGDSKCFENFDELHACFYIIETEVEYWTALNIETKEAPIEESEEGNKVIVPETAGQALNFIRFPSTFVPPFGNAKFSIWKPKLPIMYDFSPFGYAMLGAQISGIAVYDDKGNDLGKKGWHMLPTQTAEEQAGAEFDLQMKAFNDYEKSKAFIDDPKNGKSWDHEFTSTLKFSYDLQAYALAKYDWKEDFWEGSFQALASGKLDWIITWTLNLGGFPMYFIVNPYVSLNASFRLGIKLKKILDIEFVPEDKTLGVGGSIGIYGTIGFGINMFASVSFTGGGYITGFINFCPSEGENWPRYLGGFGHSGVVTAQFSFFKYTWPIWTIDKPDYWDSYKKTLVSSDGVFYDDSGDKFTKSMLDSALQKRLGKMGMSDDIPVYSDGAPSFEDLKKYAKIVTNSEMLKSKEFITDKQANLENAPVIVEGLDNLTDDGDEEKLSDIVIIPKESIVAGGKVLSVTNIDDSYLPQFSYVGEMKSGGAGQTPKVLGISDTDRGGIKPSIDNILFENVNSNPTMKLLVTKYTGLTLLFRIASVDVGDGQARSRLVYHTLNSDNSWSRPYIVNFDPQIDGVDRADMYDYEFDVTQAEGNGGENYICLLVTSSIRPNGDDTTLVEGLQAHYISLVSLYDTYQKTDRLVADPTMTACVHKTSDGHTLTTPRITGFSDVSSIAGTKDFCLMGTYVYRKVTEKSGISDEGTAVAIFARWEDDSQYEKVFTITRQKGSQLGDDYIMRPVKIDDEDYKWEADSVANCRRATFAYYTQDWAGAAKMEANYKNNDPSQFSSFGVTKLISFGGEAGPVAHKLYPWGDDGELIATVKDKTEDGAEISSIYHISFDPKNSGDPTFTKISPKSGVPTDLVIDENSHFLFYAQNIDGKVGQNYADDGSIESDIIEHRYYIMAIAEVEGLFTKPFIFCELDHIIDNFVGLTINENYVTFLASCIEDIDNSLADIYDVRVPLVKCLTPITLTTAEPFAMSGEDCEFSICIRNDGNLVARKATFTLYDAETGQKVDSKVVEFGKDTIENLQDKNAKCKYDTDGFSKSQLNSALVANGGRGVIIPGETDTYRMKFAIPKDWRDTKTVYVEISDIEVINPTGSNKAAFANYHIAAKSCPTQELKIEAVDLDRGKLADGEVHEKKNGNEDESGKKKGKGSDGGSGSDGGKDSSGTPSTGDVPIGGIAAAAAAALGAGMMAYSKRRCALENSAQDDEDKI